MNGQSEFSEFPSTAQGAKARITGKNAYAPRWLGPNAWRINASAAASGFLTIWPCRSVSLMRIGTAMVPRIAWSLPSPLIITPDLSGKIASIGEGYDYRRRRD